MSAIQFDNTYAALPPAFYSKQAAAPAPKPEVMKVNEALAGELGIDPGFLTSDAGLAMFSGQSMPEGAEPLAMVYAGHQFGGWSPQLGDGRALLLGEVKTEGGERFDIQLKGSGPTVFSRNGDGRAAVGPVIREYIMSEAMAALGVPTTRALAAVTTGERVQREKAFPGAIVTRVAHSHVRVGTFQYFAARKDAESLRTLSDYVIERHYPDAKNAPNPLLAMYEAIIARQAKLIALWLKFGFIHGVMNTDNMQIAGETIDYGPCAFLDEFDPLKVFSSIDQNGRYAWGRQPSIGQWNLARLGEALLPIWGTDEDTAVKEVKAALNGFSDVFHGHFIEAFSQKLGLPGSWDGSHDFIQSTFTVMKEYAADFTLFFSHLRRLQDKDHQDKFLSLFADSNAAENWLNTWRNAQAESRIDKAIAQRRMDDANPIYIARNHRVEEAVRAGEFGNYSAMHRLHDVLQNPMQEQPGAEKFEQAPQPEEMVAQTFCGT